MSKMHGNRGPPFPASFQKRSDSEQVPCTAFSMKMENLEEPKDKQTSSHCISFTAINIYVNVFHSFQVHSRRVLVISPVITQALCSVNSGHRLAET